MARSDAEFGRQELQSQGLLTDRKLGTQALILRREHFKILPDARLILGGGLLKCRVRKRQRLLQGISSGLGAANLGKNPAQIKIELA